MYLIRSGDETLGTFATLAAARKHLDTIHYISSDEAWAQAAYVVNPKTGRRWEGR